MQVVREQITRTLSSKPTSLELFKNKVNALNYSEILKLRQTERLHQEETLAPPVLELKERLKPELLELIRQQRLNRLCHGTLFRKISSRRRQDKLWYCRLSPNHKVLHYGDVEGEKETPSIEALQEKIPVADIKNVVTGKDCPHMKENKGKQTKLLEELFCICIQLLNKTWKEMRATQEDFDKVMQVVREQITRTLSSKPTSLELFKNKVNALNYSEILKLRQTERLHQEETLAPPVLELKERLKPELLELIRQQRLNRLCHGTLFRKISSRRRQDKLWYCRLSPNHKVLHYGDVEGEKETPSIEALQEKIPVADIKNVVTGKDCPHMKENKGKQTKEVLDLAFSITYDVEEYSLNFIASSRTDFCLWTDGLNVLLGKEMSSESMRSELEILLSMEIKLRLLDLENVPIPDTAPPIPKPPSNFNFCYDFSQAEQ
ncbi:engulfment and cell motility protein 3-like [Sinocyclocheilus grahami]|nr:PREDICTED: engulfment and cell motility protein 3-like [Sinocyclocheilus grahami]